MLKIGEFARLAQVSVKTLRYYAERGLLEPSRIDRYTGYRYYALEQLARLNRVLALKDLGFSLEQIAELLRDDLSAKELRGMLRLRHAELQQHVAEEQARLARVEARLWQIESEGRLPSYAILCKAVAAQRVLGIRDMLPTGSELPRLFAELGSLLSRTGVTAQSPRSLLALYDEADGNEQGIAVEAAATLAPADRPRGDLGRGRVHTLEAVQTMATTVHQGSLDGLPEAYNALTLWAQANGYRSGSPSREVYLRGPQQGAGPEEYVVEVQLPVESILSKFSDQQKERLMESKIVDRAAFTVVGVKYHGRNEQQEIPAMWGEFNGRMSEIASKPAGWHAYGVCRDAGPDGAFDYLACVEVTDAADVPDDMEAWTVPANTYAVFPCTLQTIGQAYEYALNTWLPRSGYQKADGPDLELYDERFDGDVEGSELTIWIPVRK